MLAISSSGPTMPESASAANATSTPPVTPKSTMLTVPIAAAMAAMAKARGPS